MAIKIDLENFFIWLVILIAVGIVSVVGWKVLQIRYGVGITESVRVGVILPFSGDSQVYGEALSDVLEISLSQINSRDGWQGAPMLLKYRDGECSYTAAESAAKAFVRERVDIIIGGFCSDETLGIASGVSGSKVLVITPASSSQKISTLGDLVFRMSISNAQTGKVLAQEAYSRGYRNVGVIYETTEYAKTLVDVFIDTFEGAGGSIIVNESFATESEDVSTQVQSFENKDVDATMVATQSGATLRRVLQEFADREIEMVYFSDLFGGVEAIREVGSSVIGTVYTEPFFNLGNTKTQEFLRDYQKEIVDFPPIAPFYLATAYDSLQILADAIEELGVEDARPATIANYLLNLEGYNGASSESLSFDKNGDANYELVLRELEPNNSIDATQE